mgnify:CR=1 FL=1
MSKVYIKQILEEGALDSAVVVRGWVRTKRQSKNVTFININDGTTIHNIQTVVEAETISDELLAKINTGACLEVYGKLIASQGNQKVEVQVEKIIILGEADPEKYPIQPKKHSFEFLREKAHLRPRTNTFGAILRIRHALAFAIHNYFNDHGFFYLHTPIITGSDAEGAGEMFRVTTLDAAHPPKTEEGKVDYAQDFFGKETNLTVSGQLEGELGAMALSKIYTFGPTFRAENSNTSRHLAEFWMIEPEVAFNDLVDNMDLAEDFLQYLVQYALEKCGDDLQFLDARFAEEEKQKPTQDRSELGLIDKLKFVVEKSIDAVHFDYLGERPAAGNSSIPRNYTLNDLHPVIGNNYYRLKMIDRDGQFKYSEIITIKVTEIAAPSDGIVAIYPNPTNDKVNVVYQSGAAQRVNLDVFNTVGQNMYNNTYEFNAGLNTIIIDAVQYAKGMYIINLQNTTSGDKYLSKFVKD